MLLRLIAIMYIIFLTLCNLLNIAAQYINKHDSQKIEDRRLIRVLVSLMASIFIGLLYIKYHQSFNFFKNVVLMMYLIITAYVDVYTKKVYTFISVTFLVLGLTFLSINIFKYNADVTFYLVSIVGSILVSSIAAIFKIFNWGDVEVFAISAIYIGGFGGIINVFISFAIGALGAVILLISKRIKLKDSCAYCPYIALSSFMVFLLI